MSSYVRFWSIGSAHEERLPLTASQIAGYLMLDWLPHFPPAKGSQFVSWPKQLLTTTGRGERYLALHGALRGSERQWKGFLSWMIGVAATRRVLAREGYRYVAPASAFYREAATLPATGRWPKRLPPGRLVVEASASSKSRLRPDYLAVRRHAGGGWEFAAVESKGTARSLASLSACPGPWHEQARNILVEHDGRDLKLSRHLVVAARSNPNAKTDAARRIQVRAWNYFFYFFTETPQAAGAVVSIAAADWYGRLLNSELSGNAELLRQAQLQRQIGPDAFPRSAESYIDQLRRTAAEERRALSRETRTSVRPVLRFDRSAIAELELLQSSEPVEAVSGVRSTATSIFASPSLPAASVAAQTSST